MAWVAVVRPFSADSCSPGRGEAAPRAGGQASGRRAGQMLCLGCCLLWSLCDHKHNAKPLVVDPVLCFPSHSSTSQYNPYGDLQTRTPSENRVMNHSNGQQPHSAWACQLFLVLPTLAVQWS
jgi:hypothetical protein